MLYLLFLRSNLFKKDYQNEKNNETKYASSVAQFHNLEAEYVKLDLNRVDPDLIKKIISCLN